MLALPAMSTRLSTDSAYRQSDAPHACKLLTGHTDALQCYIARAWMTAHHDTTLYVQRQRHSLSGMDILSRPAQGECKVLTHHRESDFQLHDRQPLRARARHVWLALPTKRASRE